MVLDAAPYAASGFCCRCPWWFENEGLAGCAAISMAFVGLHKSWNVPPKSGKVSKVFSLISGRSVYIYNIYKYRRRCNMIKFAQFGKTSATSTTHLTSCASLALPLPGISWLPMLPKIDFLGSFMLGKLFWEWQNRMGAGKYIDEVTLCFNIFRCKDLVKLISFE